MPRKGRKLSSAGQPFRSWLQTTRERQVIVSVYLCAAAHMALEVVWVCVCVSVCVSGAALHIIHQTTLVPLYLQLLFVYVDSSTEANDRIVDFFNLDKDSLPAFRIINLEEDMKRYVPKFSANCEVEKLREFVNNFNEGKLSVCTCTLVHCTCDQLAALLPSSPTSTQRRSQRTGTASL